MYSLKVREGLCPCPYLALFGDLCPTTLLMLWCECRPVEIFELDPVSGLGARKLSLARSLKYGSSLPEPSTGYWED